MKVSIYTNNIKNRKAIEEGIRLLKEKVLIEVSIAETDKKFSVSSYTFEGTTYSHIIPEQILALPSDGEVVCLVHNVDGILNPSHTKIMNNGVTPIQISESWYAEFPNIFAEFFLHEIVHAMYYLQNKKDKVHSPKKNWGGYGNPLDYYVSLYKSFDQTTSGTTKKLLALIASLTLIVKNLTAILESKKIQKSRIEDWANAIREMEGWSEGSQSQRNNNPGNIRGVDGKFLTFNSYKEGFDYLKDYLIRACTGKHRAYNSEITLREFFGVYAPSEDNNDPTRYAQFVANKLKVSINTKIKTLV